MDERFKIIEPLAGQGGYGKIDKATDVELERDVAIKTLDPLFKDINDADVERFKREAKTLAALSHPNIPAIYDINFDPDNKDFKLIYAWIEGNTVRDYLVNTGVFSLELARRFFGDICAALKHAHDKGIIHRDIKPSNLIITNGHENCYLVDFGISLTSTDIERITDGSQAVGTPGYMSPEQEANEDLEPSSDVFSLGIVLYECLSGSRPTIGEYKPLNAQNEAIPPAIDSLIRNALSNKENRIKTTDDFLKRLNLALRPSSNIGATFSQGALHEIITSLQTLNHVSFSNLPVGQRILLMTRLKTLLSSSEFHLRNPIAQFLDSLLRICGRMNAANFELISSNALIYGFEMQYGETWFGNVSIREELASLAISCEQVQHKILADSVINFLKDKELDTKEVWFLFDMRNVVQNLLANDLCEDAIAVELGKLLESLLTECYSDRITKRK